MNKPHKHCELIKAWSDGAEIEYLALGNNATWEPLEVPYWNGIGEYRIKPLPKLDIAIEALEKFANNPCYSVIVSTEAKSILREIRSME